MVMRRHVGFEAKGPVVKGNFLENTRSEESFNVLVDGAEGYGRNALADVRVDQFRGGVFLGIDDGFVDHLPLECKSQAPLLAAVAEIVEGFRAQV